MSVEISKIAVNSTAAIATSSGMVTVVLGFFDSNAASIGVMSTLFFGFIYVYFQFSQDRKLTLADKNKEEIEDTKEEIKDLSNKLDDHMTETRESLSLILKSLNKLDKG